MRNDDDANDVLVKAIEKMTPGQRECLKRAVKDRESWTVADLRIEAKAREFICQELDKIPGLKEDDTKINDVFPKGHEFWNQLQLMLEMAHRDVHKISSH
jgi:hypothetical protein